MLFTCRTVDRDWLKKPSSPSSSLPPAGPLSAAFAHSNTSMLLHAVHCTEFLRHVRLALPTLNLQHSSFWNPVLSRPHILLSSVVRLAELKIDDWTQHGYAYCRHEWDGAGAAENIDRIDDSVVSEVSSIPAELLCQLSTRPEKYNCTCVQKRQRSEQARER